jgi:Ca-activated chloride channel family protein
VPRVPILGDWLIFTGLGLAQRSTLSLTVFLQIAAQQTCLELVPFNRYHNKRVIRNSVVVAAEFFLHLERSYRHTMSRFRACLCLSVIGLLAGASSGVLQRSVRSDGGPQTEAYAAASATGAAPQSGKTQDAADHIRLDATLVQVPTVVTNRGGKFVTDLSQADFVVLEDGKRQEISAFANIQRPFNVVLVLDTSNSAQDRLRVIQNTAISFIHELGPGDRAMVISFDNEIHELTEFTADKTELETAINKVESGFGKLLYEAVAHALDNLKDVQGRRAVILFTDGVDFVSVDASAESNLRQADEIGAIIYTVQFETRWWIESEARRQKAEHPESKVPFSVDGRIPLPPSMGGPDPTPIGIPKPTSPKIEIGPAPAPRVTIDGKSVGPPQPTDEIAETMDKLYGTADLYMKTLAANTGGRLFKAENISDIRAAFAAVADELRHQYLLGYYASGGRRDGKFHKIRVIVGRKDAEVRAKPGYRVPKDR